MKKSIKRSVTIRVIAAVASVLLFSFLTTYNIFRIQFTQANAENASILLNRAQQATAAHYKWSSNLSNALYSGSEFTGSIDPTTCVLGQWLYGEAGTDDQQVLALRAQLEPLHKELHGSATQVLETLKQTLPPPRPIIRRPSSPTCPLWWACWTRWWSGARPSAPTARSR